MMQFYIYKLLVIFYAVHLKLIFSNRLLFTDKKKQNSADKKGLKSTLFEDKKQSYELLKSEKIKLLKEQKMETVSERK